MLSHTSSVTHSGTSVFDLPVHLHAKADPSLTADDERHFAVVAECLEELVSDLSRRLDVRRRDPAGFGQQTLERDADIRRLTSELATIRRFGLDLCIGHFVTTADSDPVYVGRIGLLDSGGNPLLVDWRAPAAEPFFAATLADPMGLACRRRYRWMRGRIVDYWDEMFVDGAVPGHGALDEQSAFIAGLGEARTGRMRDVLATIQADQDAIIRADSQGTLVVDGGPGTGKTVVALHRAAYLLHADSRIGRRRGNVLLVGPHRPYLHYVADVLPALGEHSVQTATVGDLLPDPVEAPDERDPEVARLKSTTRMVDAIEAAVEFYEDPPADPLIVETDWVDLRVTRADWQEAFDAPEEGTPHNEARPQILEMLVEILLDKSDVDVPEDTLRTEVLANRALRATLNKAWPMLDADEVVGDLWTVPAYLRLCAPGLTDVEVRVLQRKGPQAWTTADLPLLDAARHRLGDVDITRRELRRRASRSVERERRASVIDDVVRADDDGEGAVTMLNHSDLQEALLDDAAADTVGSDRPDGPFAHVIIDEAQELTDAEWQMILRRCPSRSLTVVGDRAQARRGFEETWTERLTRNGITTSAIDVVHLSINYRTPEEVMAAAEPGIREVLPDANVPVSVRASGKPVEYGQVSELQRIVDEWAAGDHEGIACVVGSPDFPDSSRIRSLAPEMTKGLEFDLVVLVDPESFGTGVAGAVDRYVAMTRATERLVVLSPS